MISNIFQADGRALTPFSWSSSFFHSIFDGQLERLEFPFKRPHLPPSCSQVELVPKLTIIQMAFMAGTILSVPLVPSLTPNRFPISAVFKQAFAHWGGTPHSLLICIPWAQILMQLSLLTTSVYIPSSHWYLIPQMTLRNKSCIKLYDTTYLRDDRNNRTRKIECQLLLGSFVSTANSCTNWPGIFLNEVNGKLASHKEMPSGQR